MRRLIAALATFLATLAAGSAQAAYYETTGNPVNVSQIAGTGSLSQSFYSPSAVRTLDNTSVLLYFMGTHDINPDPVSDSVYLYTAPNTWNGWNNAYTPHPSTPAQPNNCTFGCPGRILPDTSSANTLVNDPSEAYGNPWAWRDDVFFQANRKIRLLATKSDTPQTPRDILYGISGNGVAFTWYGLIRNLTTNNISVIWREVSIGSVAYWYGFVRTAVPGGARQSGAIRAQLNTSSSSDIPISAIEVWTGSGWQTLPPSSDPRFRWEFPADGSRNPKDLWQGVSHASFHKTAAGTWEIYGARNNPSIQNCGCLNQPPPGNNELVYKILDITQAGNPDAMFTAAPTQAIEAESPGSPRCMPGDHAGSRHYPHLLEWVANNKILYSATNDPSAQRPQCPTATFPGQYIVRTFLKLR
ncbi:MAG TPA: hypothetical protein VHC97_01320 [Thermoanaerobaculia bacterium]|jgi:hypothetical protein|nr:hypothetical protein [Thermoanaerobaculia bacterium]